MKLKIKIIGPNVHDVGYRPWLTELAINTALRGFEVYNDEENGQQAVIALAEADDQRIQRFYNLVRTKQPQLAKVSGVMAEDYTGDIIPVWHAAAMNTSMQLNKAIPLLLDMNGKMSQMLEKQDRTIEEIKGIREDVQPGFAIQFRQMQVDIRAIKERLGMP